MARTGKSKLLICMAALTLVMACVPTIATPAVPTVDAQAVNTFIAGTVNAAASQTAAAMPSSTWTPSITPTRNTETPSPTPTATVIFLLPSFTPVVTTTFTPARLPSIGGGGTSADNFACQVSRVSPPNGSVFGPREDFDLYWTVRNIGRKNWDRSDVDYIYSSGDKLHKISGYDLDEKVLVGNTINLGVDMQAPKDPGTYTTTWTMRVGNNEFCPLRYTITVR